MIKETHLRRLSSDDAAPLAQLANNKKIWDNLRDYMPYPYLESDANSFIERTEKEDPQLTFGIVAPGDALCGVIGLVLQKDVYRLTVEIGYWIGAAYWGRGIATRAIELITAYGFERLQLERIHTGVFEYNIASMRALEKNHYKKEGIFRRSVIKNGRIWDEHRYARLKGEV